MRHGKTGWLELEAPRYTSYPSAHHFSTHIGVTQHEAWLGAIGRDMSVSAYVHIPFCREMCWFCGCHTKMTKRYEPIANYVRVLLQEIEVLKRLTQGKGRLANIHFGGGSPSLLKENDLRAILAALGTAFACRSPGELAIELDPRTVPPGAVSLYAALGFNRVSLGIQDFNEDVQRAIGRLQPYAMVAGLVGRLRQSGIDEINFDLIYGLPFQTKARFFTTLEKTLALQPSRIALFSYAHLPDLKKHQRLIKSSDLPTALEKLELYALAYEVLEADGYVPVGIDHFARPNDSLALALKNRSLRRNFQGYVTDATDVLIGIGSSAISQFPQGIAQNSASAPEYRKSVGQGRLAGVRGWRFAGEDGVRKRIIDELMCFMSVDVDEVCRAFGLDAGYFRSELDLLASADYQEIATCEKYSVHVTTPHRMAARVVASVFDQYHGSTARRYSKVA